MPVGNVAGALAAAAATAAALLALSAGPAVAAPGSEPPAPGKQAPRERYPCAEDGWPWSCIAQCESSGRWDVNTGNGYYGGLQFWQPTWDEHGGGAFATRADLATPDEQIEIARRVLVSQGWGAWPVCSKRYGLLDGERAEEPAEEPAAAESAAEPGGKAAEPGEEPGERPAEEPGEEPGEEPNGARVTGDVRAGRESARQSSRSWLTMPELFRYKVVNAPNPRVLPLVYSGVRRTVGD